MWAFILKWGYILNLVICTNEGGDIIEFDFVTSAA